MSSEIHLSPSTSNKSGNIFKNGDIIDYKINSYDPWERGVVLNRGGKSSSKNKKSIYNIQNIESGKKISINVDLVKDWRKGNSNISFDNEDDLRNDLRKKWKTVGSPIAFAGISKIYKYYQKHLTKKQIEHILQSIPVYSKFKEVKKARLYNPFFIYYLHQQWQLDIMYAIDLKEWNDGVKYLLVVMECFSRKIFVTHMKDKSTETTITCFDDIHTHIGSTPNTLYMDKGSEFNSHAFKNYCNEFGINPIYSESSTKAALVERAQRTLQGIMYRFMGYYNTKRYIDQLDDIVKTFNSKVNRTIKMSPNNAYQIENHSKVLINLETYYNKMVNKQKKPRFNLGDKVRILRLIPGNVRPKGYKPTFSDEIFQIHHVNTRLPLPRYYLKDVNNEIIKGSFQSHELSLIKE